MNGDPQGQQFESIRPIAGTSPAAVPAPNVSSNQTPQQFESIRPIAGANPAAAPSAPSGPTLTATGVTGVTGALTDKLTPTEGTYLMVGPNGPQQIPFSKVSMAKEQGYSFGGDKTFNPRALGTLSLTQMRLPKEEKRYKEDLSWAYGQKVAQDLLADPRGRELVEGDGLDLVLGATKEAARTAVGLHDIAPGTTKPQPGEKKSALRQFSEEPSQNFGEYLGAGIEQTGEFMSGEEILGALPKILGYVPKLGEAAKILKEIESGSTAGRLMMQSLKQGAVAGGQSYVKSGGSLGEAGTSAALTTGLSALLGAPAAAVSKGMQPEATQVVEGVTMPKPKVAAPTPAESAAGEAFGKTAGRAIEEPLKAISAATGEPAGEYPVMMAQPGGAPAVPTGATVKRGIDVDAILKRTGDYATARSELRNTLDSVTQGIDKTTGGEYSRIKEEITAARNAMYNAPGEGNTAAYRQKLADMQNLIAKTPTLEPEMREALTAGWRHYMVMEDLTKGLDKALMGLPGESSVSGTYRGIDGKTLMNELGSLVRNHGRAAVDEALGGPARFDSLKAIGEATQTNAGRKSINKALIEVAKWLPAYAGGHLGYMYGGGLGAVTGAAIGRTASELAPAGLGAVRNAAMANPKIANLIVYAAKYGARPENYGPFIAKAIRDIQDEANKEEQEYANPSR